MMSRQNRFDGLEQRQLQRLQEAAQETIGALRDIIWLVQPEHGRIADLLEKMRGTATSMLEGLESDIDIQDTGAPMPLGIAFMRNVLFIYKEALHNAVRHSGATRIEVAVRVQQRALSVVVRQRQRPDHRRAGPRQWPGEHEPSRPGDRRRARDLVVAGWRNTDRALGATRVRRRGARDGISIPGLSAHRLIANGRTSSDRTPTTASSATPRDRPDRRRGVARAGGAHGAGGCAG